MIYVEGRRVEDVLFQLTGQFLAQGREVDRGEWQAMRKNEAFNQVFEAPNVTLYVRGIGQHWGEWAANVEPNLPWAEDHFRERVSGMPYNPPPSHVNWPYAVQGNEETLIQGGKFSHTYPERFSPRWAGYNDDNHTEGPRQGVRFEYGDYHHLLYLLKHRPETRQAYLPIWFPEDLNAANIGERVPCSLGYHFLKVRDTLQVTYYMRSCDYNRYLRDDLYMAGRLLQQVSEETHIPAGDVVMHIANLHIFAVELPAMAMKHNADKAERLSRI